MKDAPYKDLPTHGTHTPYAIGMECISQSTKSTEILIAYPASPMGGLLETEDGFGLLVAMTSYMQNLRAKITFEFMLERVTVLTFFCEASVCS